MLALQPRREHDLQYSRHLDRNQKLAKAKATAGANLVEAGRQLLARAHQILAESDKRLRSSDITGQDGPIRIGISSMLLSFLVDHPANALLAHAVVTSDACPKIVKAFEDEDVDIAMIMDVKNHRSILGDDLVAEFDVEFAWMKAEAFELDADAPIPLATWPPDQHIILNALSHEGRAYKVMFAGPDYFSKFTAVGSGQCVAAVPRYAITAPFAEATDDLLPPIASRKILLAVRGDPESERYKRIIALLSSFRLAASR
jgi:DNA-binding transcriptional LysR family regulator